jgi:hypothetical protein
MRRTFVSLMTGLGAVLGLAGPAAASYDARSAPLLWPVEASAPTVGRASRNTSAGEKRPSRPT